jgi:hypothetical protein
MNNTQNLEDKIKIFKRIEAVYFFYFIFLAFIFMFLPIISAGLCFGCNGEQIDNMLLTKILGWFYFNGDIFLFLTKALILAFPLFFIYLSFIRSKHRDEIKNYKSFFLRRYIEYPIVFIILLLVFLVISST